jgi:hypothetical protein
MKRFSLWSLTFVFLVMFMVGCGGKSTSLEGKVVNGKGQPLPNVKVAAKMSQPIKGYEQFETTTGSDGTFKFGKLFPTSEYQLSLNSERWKGEKQIKIESGPEGQTKILPEPVAIRFMDSKEGVVLDTKTNLMWAAKDNGMDLNWGNAKAYCENYRGSGYTDWRMSTLDELAGLYASGVHKDQVKITGIWLWTSDNSGSVSAHFGFSLSAGTGFVQPDGDYGRALPVRSGE